MYFWDEQRLEKWHLDVTGEFSSLMENFRSRLEKAEAYIEYLDRPPPYVRCGCRQCVERVLSDRLILWTRVPHEYFFEEWEYDRYDSASSWWAWAEKNAIFREIHPFRY